MTITAATAVKTSSMQEMLQRVYEPAFLAVARYVSNHGGSFEEARDVFHDALLILYEHLQKGTPIQSEEAYLIGVVRHLWRKKQRAVMFTDIELEQEFPPDEEATPDEQRLLKVLEKTGRRCLELLSSFYFSGLTVQQLKLRFGFTSEHSASVQKYKCIEKIRDHIKTNALTYEDFFERD